MFHTMICDVGTHITKSESMPMSFLPQDAKQYKGPWEEMVFTALDGS